MSLRFMRGGASSGQQHSLGALELLGRTMDHDDVAVAQDSIGGRLAAEDPVTAYAGERHLDAPAAQLAERASHRPRPGRYYDRLDLFVPPLARLGQLRIV